MALAALTLVALAARRLWLARAEREGERRDEAVRPLALELLAGDPGAAEAALALSRQDGNALVRLLSRYAALVKGEDRVRIAELFERRGDVDAAISSLGAARTEHRRALAAHRLGVMGSARGKEQLLRALREDRSRTVRAVAARALGRLRATAAVEPLAAELAAREVPQGTAAAALIAIGPEATAALRALVDREEVELRALAIEMVGYIGGAADGRALAPSLRDTAAPVRASAAAAMGRLGAAESTTALRELLDDRIPAVRRAAAAALGEIRDPAALGQLLELACDDDFGVARAAAHAVGRIDPETAAAAAARSPHLAEVADLAAAGLLARVPV